MENKQSPSKKKLISIQEEKLIREVNYDSLARNVSRLPKKELLLDLEIFRKHPTQRQASQRVLVSIKPRAPAIKTIYIAEKSRFHSKKNSEKSGSRSRLGIGDHSSFNSSLHTHFSEDTSNEVVSIACGPDHNITSSSAAASDLITTTSDLEKSTTVPAFSRTECASQESRRATNVYNDKKRSEEKCYIYTQPQFTMNLPKVDAKVEKLKLVPSKVDIGTLIITNNSSENTVPISVSTIKKLSRKIDHLERKILRQEMVFRSIDPNIPLSSSDEECKDSNMRSTSESRRACCSYIQQYSHIPETSAFQRYATSSLSPSKATTLEKEHNSEQYGRDFTTYDGITARGRRQSASVPCKRDDLPKMAAERVHKIRHKLNPVRDYRLMDTVHYLAQGEFAPRDDGIKLTPSREAVLSDIIWEDVCRTHWPNTRLGRRGQQQAQHQPPPERYGARCELQRLIDSLLRERVAHVERRRRRHYRIVKLNHRHENCRPVGKTGDIIVASHKNKDSNEERELPISDHNAASAMMSDRRWHERPRKSHRSHDRLMYPETRHRPHFREDECSPGPSYVVTRGPGREPTCCYHSTSPTKLERNTGKPIIKPKSAQPQKGVEITSGSSVISKKTPRLVVKKSGSKNKKIKEEPNLEQYILLPTLVIRTPSNVKRQKKFNELYHRILNVQLTKAQECAVEGEAVDPNPNRVRVSKRDIGFNINVTLSRSTEKLKNKN